MGSVISGTGVFLRALTALALLVVPPSVALADLRTPAWYDVNAVTTSPDWHYRVPINVPAGSAVNSTIRFDVDFAALFAQMGVSGTFDINSPRLVRSSGALATTQEFTDRIFGGATDAANNSRGEVRFILEDAGAVTYYLYFDTTENGVKPANPQQPINGNFEVGAGGLAQPAGWSAPVKANAALDAQIRPAETVSITANPASVDGVQTRATDGNPFSGSSSYLIGSRTPASQIAGNPAVTFTRDFVVPSTNPGNITFRYRPEGWDTGDFDPIRIDLVTTANAVLVEMVGPTAGSYTTKPFAPNTNNAQASNTNSGFRQYNGFDCTLTGTRTLGMTVPCNSEPWFTVTQSLAAYAGQTIRLRIRSISDAADKTWYHLDDVEWSVVTPTLGAPEGFGVNITTPASAANFVPGQFIPVIAQVNAFPSAASLPMTAQLYTSAGVLAAGGPYQLYNDGTHGDAVAGDALWSNDGSILAQPAPTVPLSATNSTGWTLRVFARDATTSTIGAQNGLIRGPGTGAAAETQANYWNIDEILFNVQTAAIVFSKTSSVISDPSNGTTNPKAIPGAVVRYCLLITNNGPLAATNIIASDGLPPQIAFTPGSMRSGTSCAGASTVEDDNNSGTDESDPFGASFAAGSIITITSAIANGGVMALTFDVIVQ